MAITKLSYEKVCLLKKNIGQEDKGYKDRMIFPETQRNGDRSASTTPNEKIFYEELNFVAERGFGVEAAGMKSFAVDLGKRTGASFINGSRSEDWVGAFRQRH